MKKLYKRSILLCLMALISLTLSTNAFSFEHPCYHIQAKLDPEQKKITVTQAVTVTNNSQNSTQEVYFHIYPNRHFSKREKDFMRLYAGYFKVDPFPEGFQSGQMHIRSIKTGQEDLLYKIEGEDQTLLKVELQNALKPGQTITLNIDFSVDIPHAYGRFGWHKNIFALSRFYPILSVLENDGWNKNPFYPFHRPFYSDAAYYSVDLTVPANYTVIHSGEVKQEDIKGQEKHYRIETPLPIREFTIATSPEYKLHQSVQDDILIQSFYLAGDEKRAQEALDIAADTLRFYERRFGKYPYSTFSIAPVYLGYGGEQMSNINFIDTRVYKLPQLLNRHFDFLIAHETGHQWFYNIIGVDEFSEMWLEEGISSYFIQEYLEAKYGFDATVIEWPKYLDWLLPNFSFRRARDYRYKILARTKLNFLTASTLSSYKEPSSIFSITYGKGAAITSMLRSVIGKEVFDDVFTEIFKRFRFRNFSTSDLMQICEEKSGQDLAWFFDQWLYTTDNCDYAVRGIKGKLITLENRGKIVMPVEIEINFKDGQSETIAWDGQGRTKEISVAEDKKIRQVIIDPNQELLDIDRTNNSFPRIFQIKAVPLYLPLYDIAITLPDDRYNIVVGPEAMSSGLGIKTSFQKPYDQIFYVASGYEFSEALHKSRFGYQINNVFSSRTTAGVEIFNIDDLDGGEEDLVGGKIYLRKELKPIAYGLADVNDHATLYLIRNRSLDKGLSLSGFEDTRNVSYLKKDEAIVGAVLNFGRSGPYPDPRQGYKINTLLESSGHFLGATQYFYRGTTDISFYHPVTQKSTVAVRVKYGWGFPRDKNLYQLGGVDGLRGYDRKTIRGSNAALGSLEYRFPIKEDIQLAFLDNIIRLDSIGGVIFTDLGQSWFDDVDDADLKYDAGFGLRFSLSFGSFLEKALLRMDVAKSINDPDEDDTYIWFGVNQAY